MKLSDLINAVPALQRLSVQPMTGKLAYNLSKNNQAVDGELAHFNAAREKSRLAHTQDGKFVSQEDEQAFLNEIVAVADTEVDVKVFKISQDQLDKLSISPADVKLLWWMIDEG